MVVHGYGQWDDLTAMELQGNLTSVHHLSLLLPWILKEPEKAMTDVKVAKTKLIRNLKESESHLDQVLKESTLKYFSIYLESE